MGTYTIRIQYPAGTDGRVQQLTAPGASLQVVLTDGSTIAAKVVAATTQYLEVLDELDALGQGRRHVHRLDWGQIAALLATTAGIPAQ